MVNILYQDNSIVVALKPSGIISEGDADYSFPLLIKQELLHNEASLYTVHRLDKETQGLMVYALSPSSAAALCEQIQNGAFQKQYCALLSSQINPKSDRLCDLLYYDRARGKAYTTDRKRKGVKEAVLDYEEIGIQNGKSLIKVNLLTGRTHQIRVQFASRGVPLCGDRRYGAPPEFGNRLALCATALSFFHPVTRERLSFTTDIPDFFYTL